MNKPNTATDVLAQYHPGLAYKSLPPSLQKNVDEALKQLYDLCVAHATEYSITDAEMTAHQTGYDGKMMIPVEALAKIFNQPEQGEK